MDKRRRLEEESIPKLLWEYSLPAVAGTLVYILYNIVDRIFISFGVGTSCHSRTKYNSASVYLYSGPQGCS